MQSTFFAETNIQHRFKLWKDMLWVAWQQTSVTLSLILQDIDISVVSSFTLTETLWQVCFGRKCSLWIIIVSNYKCIYMFWYISVIFLIVHHSFLYLFINWVKDAEESTDLMLDLLDCTNNGSHSHVLTVNKISFKGCLLCWSSVWLAFVVFQDVIKKKWL